MLSIRLVRAGKKHQAFFKVVVSDKRRSASSNLFIEDLGFYNPMTKERKLKADRIKYWLSQGAKSSETIHNILVSEKIIEGKKIPVHKKKKLTEAEIAELAKKAEQEKASKDAQKQEEKAQETENAEVSKE